MGNFRHAERIARAAALAALVLAQTGRAYEWRWLNPHPTGNNLILAFFEDSSGVIVAENGEVAESGDAGDTWTLHGAILDSLVMSSAATLDGTNLIAVGADGLAWKSTDGGRAWKQTASGAADYFSVCQMGPNVALAVGQGGSVARTADGGETWSIARSDSLEPSLVGLHCGSGGLAVAVGIDGLVVKSQDSGKTWNKLPAAPGPMLTGVFFSDSLRGFAVGERGLVLDTRDGGISWQARTLDSIAFFRNIRVEGAALTITGGEGSIWKSADTGATWKKSESGTSYYLGSSARAGTAAEIVVGNGGVILRSQDGGKTWANRRRGPDTYLIGVAPASASAWFAFGGTGLILRSRDGGTTWDPRPNPGKATLLAGAFQDARKGLLTGYGGTILRTVDGGDSWQPMASGTSRWLDGVAWFDSLTAVAVGDSGTLLRSVDGGATWNPVAAAGVAQKPLSAIQRLADGSGILVGYQGLILRTTDLGATWQAVQSPPVSHLFAVSFLDAREGMAAGRDGAVLLTHDGGLTWSRASVTAEDDYLFTIAMIGRDTAVAAGDWLHYSAVRLTTDGGKTWVEVARPTNQVFNGAFRLGPAKALLVGGDGALLSLDLAAGPAGIRPSPEIPVLRAGLVARRAAAGLLVAFSLPRPGTASLAAFGLDGRLVRRWALGHMPSGAQAMEFPLPVTREALYLRLTLSALGGRAISWSARMKE